MASLTFHRAARVLPEVIATEAVTIAAPPQRPPPTMGPVASAVTVMLPAVTMMGGMSMIFVFPSSSIIKILMGGMMVMMVGGMLLTKFMTSRLDKTKRRHNSRLYRQYLAREEQKLLDAMNRQMTALNLIHPHPLALGENASQAQRLWERHRTDSDFGEVRIGSGDTPPAVVATLERTRDPLREYEPELELAAADLVERYSTLHDAPMTLRLADLHTLSVVGTGPAPYGLLRALLCQVAVAHAPEDLTIAAYLPTGGADELGWLKWLPHVRIDDSDTDNRGEAVRLTRNLDDFALVLEGEIRERLGSARTPSERQPHLLVIVDGYQPGSGVATLASLRRLLKQVNSNPLDVTVITLVSDARFQPAKTQLSVMLSVDGSFEIHERVGVGRIARRGVPDTLDAAQAERVCRALAPLRSSADNNDTEVAPSSNLFELLGVGGPDGVDPARTWAPRRRSAVMAVPLGIAATGKPLVLDLKESAVGGMGPHGLVIGATGSGKSELLRTLVTGLAVNHSPDILSFVFADFKGGAAFSDLAQLPHVAGLITNLQDDLSRVDRMYSALEGEQERRQRLLRDAGNVDGIKEYQALFAAHPEIEPMPYLMIVVDEFGELLVARPDFIDLFNAIGRVGRSLGMHLLLASQRLEEAKLRGLEGHLRYRICLRTFSDTDSRAVLGTPDAYALPSEPGAGYFKVDADIYEQFQAALVTAPYHSAGSSFHTRRDKLVSIFDGAFHPPVEAGRDGDGDDDADATAGDAPKAGRAQTEMAVAIDRLRHGAVNRRQPHQVWLPPLPECMPLNQAFARAREELGVRYEDARPLGNLRAAVGILDLPEEQRQSALVIDFSAVDGHLAVVGAPQSGKSTFLRSIIGSLALTHSPQDVQVYAVDFGGGSLRTLAGLPHVGAVCDKLERDRILRLMRQLHASLAERAEIFRKHNLDSIDNFRRMRQQGKLGKDAADILLIIDNLGQLRADFPDIDLELLPLLTTGLGYGVHVVLSAARWADIRPNLRDHISARYEFHINDPTESEMPRGKAAHLPSIAGRGLTRGGLHFQVALPRVDGRNTTSDMAAGVEHLVASTTKRWSSNSAAAPLRLLPTAVAMAELPSVRQGVALGIEENDLSGIGIDLFARDPHFLVFGDGESGKSNLLRLWVSQLAREHTAEEVQFVVVDYRRSLLDICDEAHLRTYAANAPLAKTAIEELKAELTSRLPGPGVTREQLAQRSWWSGPEYVVLVDDYDLVASPAGNPLAPLLDFMAQGRDVGMHLVLARRVGGATRSAFETVLQRLKELGTPGMILSGDPGEGPILGTQRASILPPGRAYMVRRGARTTMVQIALADHSAHPTIVNVDTSSMSA